MRVRWAPLAAEHLASAHVYLLENSPTVAEAQVERVLSAVDALERHPQLGRTGRVPGTRELVVTGTPFLVAYRIEEQEVQVLAVLHGARRWPQKL